MTASAPVPAPVVERVDRPRTAGWPMLAGATGMVFVGGSVAISAVLADAPMFSAQAVRYAVAAALLAVVARLARVRVDRPHGGDWLWLFGVALLGLVVFNLGLVHGADHAEPAVFGVAVASVPLLLAALGPVLEGRPPRRRVLVAAGIVTVGAALVTGFGRSDAVGLAWAAAVLACEAGFTLLAVPVLTKRGAWSVSINACWIGAVMFLVLGLLFDGPRSLSRLDGGDWLATAYLAVAVTAVAFVLWYSAVRALGAGRAGLLTGIAPVAAVLVGMALGERPPDPLVWLGIATVAVGLWCGLGARRAHQASDAGAHTGQ